ncbi:MAG: HEAT repeat domain-containing protein [Acidimicrobiia bacterium]
MSGTDLFHIVVLVAFVVDSLLLIGLLVVKTVHRRLAERRARRRSAYVSLISRHIVHEYCTDPITTEMAEDPAFLDGLIDVRNAVVGPELDTLHGIIDRFGVVRRQEARLRSPFPLGRRLRAAVALAEMGDDTSANVLMEHLGDHEPEIRIQAARGLGRMRWTPAIDVIVARLGTEIPWVASRFADTLLNFGRKATWPLLAYIRVNHRFETKGPVLALRTLASIGDDEAVRPVMEILDQATDPEIAIAAVETLGVLGSPLAADRLREAAHSLDWRIRAKSVAAFGDIGDPSAAPVLADSLTDDNWWVRRNSAAALARIPGGFDHLYQALNGPDRYAADAAAEALADTGELVAARRRMDEGSPTVRDLALLGHMADRALVSP